MVRSWCVVARDCIGAVIDQNSAFSDAPTPRFIVFNVSIKMVEKVCSTETTSVGCRRRFEKLLFLAFSKLNWNPDFENLHQSYHLDKPYRFES